MFILGVTAASGCRADIDIEALAQQVRDSLAIHRQSSFGLPPGHARGKAEDTLALDPTEYIRIYEDLLPGRALGAIDRVPPVDDRPMLDARFLAHEGEQGQPEVMPAAMRAAMLATGRFRGACGIDTLPPCSEAAGESYSFSRIYRIAPGRVRVFSVRTDSASVTERVYRLEQRRHYWEVTDDDVLRYRGPMYPH